MTKPARAPALAAALLAAPLVGAPPPAQAYKLFVSNERGNTVIVLDGATWEVLAEFPAGNRPRGIALRPTRSTSSPPTATPTTCR